MARKVYEGDLDSGIDSDFYLKWERNSKKDWMKVFQLILIK